MSCQAKPLCASLVLLALAAGCGETRTPARKATQKADASLSAASVKVAEPVDLAVSVEHPEGTEALFPPDEAELGGLEIVRAGKVRSPRGSSRSAASGRGPTPSSRWRSGWSMKRPAKARADSLRRWSVSRSARC